MFKHILISSLQSAFVAAVILTVLGLAYGGAAIFFGLFAFVVTLIFSLMLAYPLIKLWQKYTWTHKQSLIVFVSVGFFVGYFTPVVMFGGSIELSFDLQSFKLLGIYGALGFVASLCSWHYVRKNIAL